MIYGYCLKSIDAGGLLEMKEVTFVAPSGILREIATFLSDMADRMDAGDFARCDHTHIGSHVRNWNAQHPDKDIIVMLPSEIEHVDKYVG